MSTKTTVEQAYFHVSNGGLTFSVIEKVDVRKNCTILPEDWCSRLRSFEDREAELATLPREDRWNRTWVMRVQSSFLGCQTRYDFPIIPLMVRWLIEMLQRLLVRMEAPQEKPTDGIEFCFRDTHHCTVVVKNGVRGEERWPPGPVVGGGYAGCEDCNKAV